MLEFNAMYKNYNRLRTVKPTVTGCGHTLHKLISRLPSIEGRKAVRPDQSTTANKDS